MTSPADWIAGRRPPPPMPLDAWVPKGGAGSVAFTAAGLAALERAEAEPGRVRGSAFHLLAADALITYACEAALDEDDPREALRAIGRALASAG